MGLHKYVPVKLLGAATMLKNMFGTISREDKALIYNYAKFIDTNLVRWSLHAILSWEQHERLPGVVHVHCSRDFMLPLRYTRPDYIVKDGGHLIVFNKADEVNRILTEVLSVG